MAAEVVFLLAMVLGRLKLEMEEMKWHRLRRWRGDCAGESLDPIAFSIK
jgi:hypothetical protein